jgi:glycine cleavage system H protein
MVALFVALMFIGFILVDAILQKIEARRAATTRLAPARAFAPQHPAFRAVRRDAWPALPEGVYLSEGHGWLRPQEQGAFQIGPDPLVGQALGVVTRVVPPRVGSEMWAGRPLFQVEAGGRTISVGAPVTGRVVAVNGELQDRPELVVKAPYEEGWVCAFLPSRLVEEKPVWRLGQEATAWFEQEIQRFSQFLWTRFESDLALGETSLDGGVPAPGSLSAFDKGTWKAFEIEFLNLR